MVSIQRIKHDSIEFPSTDLALNYPNGLLAVGGDLSTQRLLSAYRHGIFPWFEDHQPIMWWSPDPRSVLFPSELKVSRSLQRRLRNCGFRVTADRVFHQVITACAAPRGEEQGTWITNGMARAYMELHRSGHAHSIEVWSGDNELVGGLYGVGLAPVYFGESMFSRANDASKIALLALVRQLRSQDYDIIDCQVESEHLNSMGARNIPRQDFETHVAHTSSRIPISQHWQLEIEARELL